MRKGCAENVMFGVFEIFSRNQTVYITLGNGTAVNIAIYFHEFCLIQEAKYNAAIKIKKPSFLGDSLSVIEQLETDRMCDLIYSDDSLYNDDVLYNNASLGLCKSAVNGISEKGMTAILF